MESTACRMYAIPFPRSPQPGSPYSRARKRGAAALVGSCRRNAERRPQRANEKRSETFIRNGQRRFHAGRLHIPGNVVGGVRTERFDTLLQAGICPLQVFRLQCELLLRRLCKRAILQTCTQLRLQAIASSDTARCVRPLRRRRRSHLLVAWMPSGAMLALRALRRSAGGLARFRTPLPGLGGGWFARRQRGGFACTRAQARAWLCQSL